MADFVRVTRTDGFAMQMVLTQIDGTFAPYLLVHETRCVARVKNEADAKFLAQAWAMRDMLLEIASLTPDSRIGVDRMKRINALIRAAEPDPAP